MTLIAMVLFWCGAASAQTIPLQAVSPDDFEIVARELSASGLFSGVAGAGTLGHLFGVEVGVTGGLTNTPGIHRIARDADPAANVKQVPSANIYAAVTVPLGLTVEGGFVPRIGGRDYKFENFGLAVKWTPTELFFAVPLDLAVRAQMVKTSLQMSSVVDNVPTHLNFDGKATAIEVIASKNIGILTPFASIGATKAVADVTASGVDVFDTALSTSSKASAHPSGAVYRLGVEIHLLILNAGVEYERALGADRFNAKLAVGF